jgi:hypothetical protein
MEFRDVLSVHVAGIGETGRGSDSTLDAGYSRAAFHLTHVSIAHPDEGDSDQTVGQAIEKPTTDRTFRRREPIIPATAQNGAPG